MLDILLIFLVLVVPIVIGTILFSAVFIPWAVDQDFKNRNKKEKEMEKN